jgi:enoyl-CoA hydratase/carnithine racemase
VIPGLLPRDHPGTTVGGADVHALDIGPAPEPRRQVRVSIAQLERRARGGGREFVLSLDMRFGAIGRALLGQSEVALGIIPGGSGTQRLPRLMGRSRALEIILGCEDFPAELAERYGYINRALPPGRLGPFLERLAYRIASFPAEAIAQAKALRRRGRVAHPGGCEDT